MSGLCQLSGCIAKKTDQTNNAGKKRQRISLQNNVARQVGHTGDRRGFIVMKPLKKETPVVVNIVNVFKQLKWKKG